MTITLILALLFSLTLRSSLYVPGYRGPAGTPNLDVLPELHAAMGHDIIVLPLLHFLDSLKIRVRVSHFLTDDPGIEIGLMVMRLLNVRVRVEQG